MILRPLLRRDDFRNICIVVENASMNAGSCEKIIIGSCFGTFVGEMAASFRIVPTTVQLLAHLNLVEALDVLIDPFM